MTHVVPATTGRQPAAGRSSVSPSPVRTRTLIREDGGVIRRTDPAQRAAGHHRAAARAAVGQHRGLGRRRLARRVAGAARLLALPRAPAVQGHRASAPRSTSRSRSTRSAGSSTPSPPRSTPASTPGSSTRTCRWPSTCSATWSPARCSRAEDVEAERDVILDEIAMHDDDPDDVVHNLFAAPGLGRLPARPPDRRHRRVDRGDDAASRSPLLPAPLPPRRTWSSPSPATSTTRPSCAGCARRSAATASSTAPSRRSPARQVGASRVAVGAGRRRGHPPVRAGQRRARRERADPRRRRAASPSACSTPRSAAARRPGCSRRSARSAAWPTRSSPSPATTPTPAWSASRSAACPPSSTRCSPSSAPSSPRSPPTASTDEELARGKGQLSGGLVLGLEDSGSRMSRLGKAELVDDELLSIDEVHRPHRRRHPRRRPHPGGRAVLPARDPRRRRSPLIASSPLSAASRVDDPGEPRHRVGSVEGPQHLLATRAGRARSPASGRRPGCRPAARVGTRSPCPSAGPGWRSTAPARSSAVASW